MKKPKRKPSRKRASALAFALITTACLAIAAASVLSLANHEHRMTMRGIMYREATNALESTINSGVGQIYQRIGNNRQYASNVLIANPLVAPAASSFGYGFGPVSDLAPESAYNGNEGLARITNPAAQVTLRGGFPVSSGRLYQIPSGNPTSANDPMTGQTVFSRTFPILASVSVPVPGGEPINVFARADLVIRDANLFNYAIFYNTIPIEMGPGQPMSVRGPIRANGSVDADGNLIPGSGDFYMGGASGSVRIFGKIAATGNIFYGAGPDSGGQSTASATAGNAWHIPFTDRDNNGKIDSEIGVSYNGSSTNKTGSSFVYSNNKAELISMYITDSRDKIGFLDSRHPDWKNLIQTLSNGYVQDSAHGVTPIPLTGLDTPNQATQINQPPLANPTTADAETENVKFSNKAGLYLVVEPDGVTTAFDNPRAATTYKSITGVTPEQTRADRDAWKSANGNKVVNLEATGAISRTARFTDRRGVMTSSGNRSATVRPVDVDLSVLRSYINGTSATPLAYSDAESTPYPLDKPEKSGWNGIVYVDVEEPVASDGTTMTAVRIINASRIPNRAEVNGSGAPGLTIATNAPIYSKGHVNADGDINTGSDTEPDHRVGTPASSYRESPMLLVGDAYTPLSDSWNDALSAADQPRPSGHLEISSALMVGVVSSKNKNYSGGVQNFPRLLETWDGGAKDGGNILRIRGSMIAMFESRVATGRWRQFYYSVPRRQWGFSSIFAEGAYPPGSPNMRSYRKMNYRLLSRAEFLAELESTWVDPNGRRIRRYPRQ